MKRFLSALLIMVLLVTGTAACALTAEEALGLGESGTSLGSSGNRYPTLQYGSRDGDDSAAYVVMLQNRLQSLGYLNTMVDGQYGGQTEAAVYAFQAANGLTPTGIADDSTQSVLYSTTALVAPVSPDLEDSDIVRLQRMLMRYGFLTGRADGVAGESTQTAIAEFKEYIYNTNAAAYAVYATAAPTAEPTLAPDEMPVAMDMPLNAVVSASGHDGEITDDLMKFVTGENQFRVFQYSVQEGNEGPEVMRVQKRLRQLDYLYAPDGAFGGMTTRALKYFQKKNNLPETGVADQATQEMLFSDQAVPSEEYIFPYKVGVSIEKQRVYIYGWDGNGYNEEVDSFKCSTGMDGYDTPTGIYQSGGKVTFDEWYYFADYNCYAKYAYRIVGGILFHSVLYNSSKKGPTNSSVRALGRKASHGCIRLAEEKAKWIFENCPLGTTIVIQ